MLLKKQTFKTFVNAINKYFFLVSFILSVSEELGQLESSLKT